MLLNHLKKLTNKGCIILDINETLSKKIVPNNYGLADTDKSLTTLYSSKRTTQMSTSIETMQRLSNIKTKFLREENITLKSASKAIQTIISQTSNRIIIRIDYEVSEYEILESLDKNNVLKNVDYILLEWHFKGEKPIVDILNKNGHTSFSRQENYNL